MGAREHDESPRKYLGLRHLPLLLAILTAATAICVALIGPGSARAEAQGQLSLVGLEENAIGQINEIRIEHGLRPLVFSAPLFNAASAHCQQMLQGGYFGHGAPTGVSFSGRLESYYPPHKWGAYSVGENLFWSPENATSAEIVSGWMASPEHRANILNPSWRQIGIAAMVVSNAAGVYAGGGATIITADFGVRA